MHKGHVTLDVCAPTGRIYHLTYDPPPTNTPGLSERLVPVPSDTEQALNLTSRLSTYQETAQQLQPWLARFAKLRRPVSGSSSVQEVLATAGDVAGGLLQARVALAAVQGAAAAAAQACESAQKVGTGAIGDHRAWGSRSFGM